MQQQRQRQRRSLRTGSLDRVFDTGGFVLKRTILAAVLCAACLTLGACSVNKGSAKTATDAASTEASTEETMEEESLPTEISQGDADAIVAEKLEGTKANAIYNDLEDVNDKNYYTYSVVDADGNELDQMLAVDAVSGEVYAYDFDNEELADFSTFSLYNPQNAEVSWSGTFTLDKMQVTLDPADDNAFEFEFTKDGEVVNQGVAQVNGNKASYENDEVSLTFEFESDGSLKVEDSGNINSCAGIYAKAE